ncbi:Gfo/Idh/MocA family protein [Allorhizocola rhizosphaerae]|uniref:Gfo/Idh/MocA family protein n=1 Tax=Allorhizocola rhizosphaerae TaxID=1872709 RepID=UPI001B8D94FF|nr:Gfo/Idh/MocA family oxidoreductase [Allorhizocola rhizosphaerae]
MSAADIRWGILATGGIAARFAEDVQANGMTVGAVGSRTPQKAEEFAQRFGIPRAWGSWSELANDPGVDVVYVATPHSHHHEASLLCLRAGKPLLVEKAFTLDLAQAQDLVTTARSLDLFLMEAMWTRTLPATLRMLELIGNGAIGEVTAVQAAFGLGVDFEPSHRLRDPLLGGGALLDLGVYPVTFAQLLLGTPHHVRAWSHLHPEGTDARTGIVLGFPTGAVATLYCGVSGDVRAATVVGTRGRIEFPHGFHAADRFVLHRPGHPPEEITTKAAGLQYQAAEVVRCLQLGLKESPLVPLEATLSVMRTLDAVRAQIGVYY